MADRAGVVRNAVLPARGQDLRSLPTVLRAASDERLVVYMRAGSRQAFEVIFERYYGPVHAFCRHMLSSWEEAEDATQQTFLAAYEDLSAEMPTNLRAWLYTVARHRCLSALRADRARSGREESELAVDSLLVEVAAREDLPRSSPTWRGCPMISAPRSCSPSSQASVTRRLEGFSGAGGRR